MASLRPEPMAARSVLPPTRPRRPTRGTRPASPMAGRPAKIRRACAKAAGSSSILPICAIPTATSSAPCTGWRDATWALASLEGRLALFLHRRSRLLGVFTFLDLVEHALGPAGLFGRSQRQNTFRDKTLQRFQHQR